MTDGLPTARTTLHTGYVRVLVFCNSCRHQADANLQAIVDAGRGDVPLRGGSGAPRAQHHAEAGEAHRQHCQR